jgi:site-specific DNA-methyltransferase (adenine-specific)
VRTFADGTSSRKTAGNFNGTYHGQTLDTTPATEAARQWEGWGTALKPAAEEWWLLRKPLSEKTVAANVLKWGTGGINVDGGRVECADSVPVFSTIGGRKFEQSNTQPGRKTRQIGIATQGRWPANLIHSGEPEVLAGFPDTHSTVRPNCYGKTYSKKGAKIYGKYNEMPLNISGNHNDAGGSAARFFYCAKASKSERDAGITQESARNHHPTVKPQALCRYLCRLITPPGGIVLDPFMGSGSTGKAALAEGFGFIGIERDPEYLEIARARIAAIQDKLI